jgi:hypothetical protein
MSTRKSANYFDPRYNTGGISGSTLRATHHPEGLSPLSRIPSLHPPSAEIPWPMSDSWGQPWSDNPYAPQIPYWLYFAEKVTFAGTSSPSDILWYAPTLIRRLSVLTRLFDHHPRDCHRSVLPMHGRLAQSRQSRKGGYQVGTRGPHYGHVLVCDDIHRDRPRHQSICYIDNRDFPGVSATCYLPDLLDTGSSSTRRRLSIVAVMFLLNNSLLMAFW